MDTLTITLNNPRLIDGYIQASIGSGIPPDAIALEFLEAQGRRYADGFRIGIITSAAFVSRFTPAEYGGIIAAAAEPTEAGQAVAGLVAALVETASVYLDDPRLEPGLEMLAVLGLIDPERVQQLLAYERPVLATAADDEVAEWAPPESPSRFARYEAPDGSTWVWDQPRNSDGTYLADDPETQDVESALQWVQEAGE